MAARSLEVGDVARAIDAYRRSYELDGRPITLVLLARTYDRAGEPLAALELYRLYLTKLRSGQRAFAVEDEIARLSKLIEGRIPVFPDVELPPALRELPVFDDPGGKIGAPRAYLRPWTDVGSRIRSKQCARSSPS